MLPLNRSWFRHAGDQTDGVIETRPPRLRGCRLSLEGWTFSQNQQLKLCWGLIPNNGQRFFFSPWPLKLFTVLSLRKVSLYFIPFVPLKQRGKRIIRLCLVRLTLSKPGFNWDRLQCRRLFSVLLFTLALSIPCTIAPQWHCQAITGSNLRSWS